MNPRLFTFAGGAFGRWRVTRMAAVVGDPVAPVSHVEIVAGQVPASLQGIAWTLRGVTSNVRYITRSEIAQLEAKQQAIGRAEAAVAALIPIRKNAKWWGLSQDERRRILEERSGHVKTGLEYLPAIARRLHHCRDLGENEPFDFLTYFEYAPSDAARFEELADKLRATEEWAYVDREVDIRMVRIDA